jgi:glycosyltransferase involved in cell wall biosynthesis
MALPPGIPLFFHILLVWSLVARTVALRPDVVHFFKPKAYAGLAHVVLWWLRRLGLAGHPVRLVVDADDWEEAWNAVLPYPWWQKRLFRWQEQWGLKQADAVTAASRALTEMARTMRQPDEQVFYLPNGYPRLPAPPPDSADVLTLRRKWGLADAPLVLLYSRFAEFQLERIVELVQAVARQQPQVRWLVVGRGLYDEERQLAALLESAGLAGVVTFAGWQPVEVLPLCFAAADVAVHPYDDTPINRTKCSVKLIDLLLAGVPVVADAVGQNSEYIEDGVSGMLVDPNDSGAMAGAVVGLLHSPDVRQQLAATASNVILSHYSWAGLAQVAEQAYRSRG